MRSENGCRGGAHLAHAAASAVFDPAVRPLCSTAFSVRRKYQPHPRCPLRWLRLEPTRPATLDRKLRLSVISIVLPPPLRAATRSSQVEPGSTTFDSRTVCLTVPGSDQS